MMRHGLGGTFAPIGVTSMRPFGVQFEAVLGPFWLVLGSFGNVLTPFWFRFESIWVRFGSFCFVLVRLCPFLVPSGGRID